MKTSNFDLIKAEFFDRDTKKVAKDLLGKILRVQHPGEPEVLCKIVETEAYLGLKDPACHTFGGKRSPRNESMWQKAGTSYVYFIYGMYHCLNFVTRSESEPEAVLIRALEPLSGQDLIKKRRKSKKEIEWTNGPGKLCLALNIDKKHDGLNIEKKPIQVLSGDEIASKYIVSSPRIGIGTKHDACFWKLRFFIKDNPWVSKVPSGNPM